MVERPSRQELEGISTCRLRRATRMVNCVGWDDTNGHKTDTDGESVCGDGPVLVELRRGAHGERGFFGWQLKQPQGRYTLPFPVKDRLSLLPSDDEGNRRVLPSPFNSFRSVCYPYLKDVRSSPGGCCRSEQARTTQASTFFGNTDRTDRTEEKTDCFRARLWGCAHGERCFFGWQPK